MSWGSFINKVGNVAKVVGTGGASLAYDQYKKSTTMPGVDPNSKGQPADLVAAGYSPTNLPTAGTDAEGNLSVDYFEAGLNPEQQTTVDFQQGTGVPAPASTVSGETPPTVDRWGMTQQALDEAAANSGKNIETIEGQSDTIQKGFEAKQDEATRQQALMARKAAAMSALRGGSAGGGAAQAGGAQAALSGQSLQNQATTEMTGQKIQQARDIIGARQAMIDNQMKIAESYLAGAMSEEDRQKAADLELKLRRIQGNVDLLSTMVESGQLTDPAAVVAEFNKMNAEG
jgi:hypothetical protein